MASEEKNRILGTLSSTQLRNIFGYYRSANPDLQAYVERFDEKPDAKIEPMGGGLSLPCVFGISNVAGLRPPPAAAKDQVVRRLFDAETALRSGSTMQPQALDQILNVLETTQSYQEGQAGWSATYYAGLAAKLSLRQSNPQYSGRILLRGLQLEPDSEVLQYLARVFISEGVLKPQQTPVGGTDALTIRAKERPDSGRN